MNDNMEVTIKTDNKWRHFKDASDLPKGLMENQFAHLMDSDMYVGDAFIKYRDWWYHISDFMAFSDRNSPLKKMGWLAYHADSYFSGVVISIDEENGTYKIGTYYS